MSEWMDIESASKDGTWILLYDPKKNVAIGGSWHNEPETNNSNAYEPGWSWWVSDEDYVMWDDGCAPAAPQPTGRHYQHHPITERTEKM